MEATFRHHLDERDQQLASALLHGGDGAKKPEPPATASSAGAGGSDGPAGSTPFYAAEFDFIDAQNAIHVVQKCGRDSGTFRARLDQELIEIMPPCAATALEALERNCNAHGEFMGGQTRLAKSVPSPTLQGRGRPSSTGHASRRTIHDGLKWLEEHGVITSWIPKAGLYSVKAYKFANRLVRRNLARLKRLKRRLGEFAQGRSRTRNREEISLLEQPPEYFGTCSICRRVNNGHSSDCPRYPRWRRVCRFVCALFRRLVRRGRLSSSPPAAVVQEGVPDEW